MPDPRPGETPVEVARERVLEGLAPTAAEDVALGAALGRVLAAEVLAAHDQPPFDASAMDGYAVLRNDPAESFRVIGESAAGRPFEGTPAPGETVRIFTGAAAPPGTRVVVQERARRDGERVFFDGPEGSDNIRPRGGDFARGARLLEAGTRLDPWRLALCAAAGCGSLPVRRAPVVAVLSTGEELAAPGTALSPGQIYDSGSTSLAALLTEEGARPQVLRSAKDSVEDIVGLVEDLEADLLVTLGGASVGDHDLVKPALRTLGLTLAFETVRMRPGKPTWFGRLGSGLRVLGLPGNPASGLVGAELFLRPAVRALLGRAPGPRLTPARAAEALAPCGIREHWMRGRLERRGAELFVRPFPDQDSSLVTVFAAADALIRREANAPAAAEGAPLEVLLLRRS